MSTASTADRPENRLLPCPASPNCVSSLASDRQHAVSPLTFDEPPELVWQRLRAVLDTEKRMTIRTEEGGYLHAEFRSRVFGFVDDVEFLLLPEEGMIHIRSASRTGYSDFGVNRKRIERLRLKFRSRDSD